MGMLRPQEYRAPWIKAGGQVSPRIGTGSFDWERRFSVKKGDTLYALSRRYGVPLRLLIDANHLKPPYHVQHGQSLRVPAARWHVVAPGDTVVGIARRYHISLASLVQRNNLRDPYVIRVGQTLMTQEDISGGRFSCDEIGAINDACIAQSSRFAKSRRGNPLKRVSERVLSAQVFLACAG